MPDDYDFDPVQQHDASEPDDAIPLYDAEHAAERQPIAALWHIYLFFRPRYFFRHFVIDESPALTALCAWLYGIAGMIDRLESRGERYPGLLDSWVVYWGYAIVLGAIAGLLSYAIGGWWYRLRIVWSGDDDPDRAMARRVYLYAAQVIALPYICVAVVESCKYATPRAAADAESLWYLLLLIAPFWSLCTSYAGVRTAFDVRRGPAFGWFVLLPGVFYLLIYGAAFGVGYFWLADEADVKHPHTHQSDGLTFVYPGNWEIDESLAEYDPSANIFVETFLDAGARIQVYWTAASPAEELDATLFSVRPHFEQLAETEGFTQYGRYAGVGRSYVATDGEYTYNVRMFVSQLGGGLVLEVYETCESSAHAAASVGFELIRQSLNVNVRHFTSVDTDHPQTHAAARLTFQYPGNWSIDDDDEFYAPDSNVAVEAFQDAFAHLMLYESEDSPANEIEASVAHLAPSFGEIRKDTTFTQYGHFQGVGQSYIATTDNVQQRIRIFVTDLGKNVVLEVREIWDESVGTDVAPGFELIRETLRVDTADAPTP